jgi:hypothetical protein
LAHAPVVEGANVFFFIDFDLFVATSGGVGNIELQKITERTR